MYFQTLSENLHNYPGEGFPDGEDEAKVGLVGGNSDCGEASNMHNNIAQHIGMTISPSPVIMMYLTTMIPYQTSVLACIHSWSK